MPRRRVNTAVPAPAPQPAPLDKVFDALKELAASGLTGKRRVLTGRRKKAPPKSHPELDSERPTGNAFCPTGPGGGIDPTCDSGEGSGSELPRGVSTIAQLRDKNQGIGSFHDDEKFYEAVRRLHNSNNPDKIDDFSRRFPERFRQLQVAAKFRLWKDTGEHGDFGDFGHKEVTLFRGVLPGGSDEGRSWSVRERVAEVFSRQGGSLGVRTTEGQQGGRVVSKTIKVNDIWMYSDMQGEGEVILPPSSSKHRATINIDPGPCTMPDPLHQFSRFVLMRNKAPTQRDLADAVYELMDDVTKTEATDVARAVLQGYAGDAAVEDVARELKRKLGFDDARAAAVAVTETTRVRAADSLSGAAGSGFESVRFRAHAGACPECQKLNGRKFSLGEAQHRIPVHPHCGCGWESEEPVANERYSFASTHYDVTDPAVVAEVARLRAALDPADVVEVPDDLHVTVLYGLEELDPERVKLLLSEAGTPFARVGPLSLFRNADADVLKFDLDSPQLHALYRRLRLLPHTLTHPEYQPHVTVAYLKSGTGDKYLDLPQAATGRELTLTGFVYSTWDGDGQVLNVFCPTGPGGGVDATCSPHGTGGPQPGVNPHHTGKGVADYVAGAAKAAGVKLTVDHLAKVAHLNPTGVAGGEYVAPLISTKKTHPAQVAYLEVLKAHLPAGTVIKVAELKASELHAGKGPAAKPKVVGTAGATTPHTDQPVQIGGGPPIHPGDPNYDVAKKVKAKLGSSAVPTHQPAPTLPNPNHVKVLQTLPGSTQPKLVEDVAGHKWVMKSGAGKEPQVRNEATADAVYRALGVPTPHGGLHAAPDGTVTKFTQYLEGAQTLADWSNGKSKAEVATVHNQLGKNFALDALLANWDVVGLTKDNILVIDHGHGPVALRADNGGALLYRAQGAPKGDKFGKEVKELESLRDPKVNPSTAAVFKHLTDQDVAAQMKEVLAKKPQILQAVQEGGSKEAYDRVKLRLAYFEEKLAGGYGAPQPKPAKVVKGEETPDHAGLPEPKGNPSPALTAHAKATIAKWTPEELAAVKSYTGGGYSSLNSNMRQCPPQFDCLPGELKTRYERIESALAKAPPLPEPVDVLRKITIGHGGVAEKFLAAARAARDSGGDYRMPSITSTTVKKSIGFGSEGSGGAKFLIRARTGVYVDSISLSRGEKELVQSSKARYKVVDVISEPGMTHIVHLEEVL